jgi:hypothetical protein
MERLERLHRVPPDGGFHNVRYARLLTDLFQRYYSHAAPFSRAALEDVWRRCRGPRCAAGRAQAEKELGLLSRQVGAVERAAPQP